jgi:hypothetical protein
MPALLALTTVFYTKHVPDQPELVKLFGSMSADHPEKVAAWLSEVFGGPAAYSAAWGGYSTMLAHHIGKGITEAQRSLWVAGMAPPPTRPACRQIPSSGPPSRPTSNGVSAGDRELGRPVRPRRPACRFPVGLGVQRNPGSRASALPSQERAVVPEQTLPADGER